MSVSTIIPAFNAGRYLAEAIESVLAQTLVPDEVVVVDDGSTDDTAAVVRRFPSPVRLLSRAHEGIGAARNAGIEQTRGDWLSFLDADDRWTPDKIRLQMDHLERHPDVDMVFGWVTHFYSPELSPIERERLQCPPAPQKGQTCAAMLVRRSSFLRVGLFEPGWTLGEFVSWYCRAQELGLRPATLEEVVLHRRVHGLNTTIRERDAAQDYVRILRAALKRRRSSADPGGLG